MPILGADMRAGTLVEWHKKPGDKVTRGDIVADVETDKGVVEVEIFMTGVVEKLLVEPGTKVPVGTPLALIREEGAVTAPSIPATPPPPVAPAPTPAPPVAAPATRPRISPAARKRAAELGVDVSTLTGSGPSGAINVADVERAAAAPAALKPEPADVMRQTIGAAMARSKREIPHYYLSTTIDLARTAAWLEEANRARPVTERLLPVIPMLRALALALREVPELNALWVGDRVVPSAAIHLGIAISLRSGGLVAPALHDADKQSLDQLMKRFRDLVQRARAGSLRSSELSDATITVTSLGDQGVETEFGIIYPPQVAIVGLGKIVERPWVADGKLVPRPLVTATLSADHRVSDGHRGGLFLSALDRLLQEPEKL